MASRVPLWSSLSVLREEHRLHPGLSRRRRRAVLLRAHAVGGATAWRASRSRAGDLGAEAAVRDLDDQAVAGGDAGDCRDHLAVFVDYRVTALESGVWIEGF